MKPIIILLFACTVALAADDRVTVQDVQTTASSLDALLAQHKEKVAVFAQGKWHKGSKDPINIAAVTPVVSRKLQIDGSLVNDMLQKDPSKLSELVMAKLLSEKTGEPWDQIMKDATEQTLIQKLQTAQIPLEKIESTLNNIYSDISFAIMDYETHNEAVGRPASGEKGSSSGRKPSKK